MGIFYKKADIPDHLQKYFVPAEIGLEQTPDQYIAAMVDVFRCVRDVLADDGTLWLNIGDSYFSTTKGTGGKNSSTLNAKRDENGTVIGKSIVTYEPVRLSAGETGCKPKDLIGIPWMLAFALRDDGWYLRQDIIWHKPNPMPESVRDRCTKAHEYVFLLSKSPRYYYDSEAMKEPAVSEKEKGAIGRGAQGSAKAVGCDGETRNRRSVWTVPTRPYKGAHFATFPPALIEPCILAGSRAGDVVLDPFMGSGTTAMVAANLGRQYLGCELNERYRDLQNERMASVLVR